MSKKVEKRFTTVNELRADTGAGEQKRTVMGYAAVFESETRIGDYYVEKIAKGAFQNSVKNNDVRALWSHNLDMVIGRTANGSLRLAEDAKGLSFELDLPDTTWGRDAYEMIRTGLVSGVSFGFTVVKESWLKGKDGSPHMRTLEEVQLMEISPTAFPAYEDTQVSARSCEEVLREAEKRWEETDPEEKAEETAAEEKTEEPTKEEEGTLESMKAELDWEELKQEK